MANVSIRMNEIYERLYCVHCKTLIKIGEKYFIQGIQELDQVRNKIVHVDCLEEIEEDNANVIDNEEDALEDFDE